MSIVDDFLKTSPSAQIFTKSGKNKKRLRELKRNRPIYEINPEIYENVEIAKRRAYGQDPSVITAKTNLDVASSEAVSSAQQTSDSGANILAVLSAVNANKQQSFLNLAEYEAGLKSQNISELYQANYALSEEKDKSFDYNINTPYQEEVKEKRERIKAREERVWGLINPLAAMGAQYGLDQIGNTGVSG
jgi:hypothetical protein